MKGPGDDVFKMLKEYLSTNHTDIKDLDEANLVLGEFMEKYNKGLLDFTIDDLEKTELEMLEDRLDKAQPDCDLNEKLIKEIEIATKKYLQINKANIKESGYADFVNRPYFRLKAFLVDYYADQLLYNNAINHAKEILKYNPNDNLGMRYILINIYLLMFDHKKVKSFFRSDSHHNDDDLMLVPMITSTILNKDLALSKILLTI